MGTPTVAWKPLNGDTEGSRVGDSDVGGRMGRGPLNHQLGLVNHGGHTVCDHALVGAVVDLVQILQCQLTVVNLVSLSRQTLAVNL